MTLSVRHDLHFCRLAADYVFLCLRTGRYFLLRGASAECFGRFLAGDANQTDIAWLVERELVSDEQRARPYVPDQVPRPTASFHDTAIRQASLAAVAAVLVAQYSARRELAAKQLSAILPSLAHAGVAVEDGGPAAASLDLAAAFQRARRYAPAIDQCLVRSLAMKRMLIRRKCPAWLVIGVTMPFAAHCWVQAGDVLLSDPLDMVLPYRPILAVR